MPLVISPRGMLSPEALAFSRARKRLFWMLLQRSALLGAGCLHATSEKERNDIRQQGIKLPVCIIPNGIDIPAPSPRPPAGAQRTLLFLGRLHPVKRVETLLASWAKLWQRHPDWRLEIAGVGDDGYVRRLRNQAEAMQGAPVAFTGPLYGSHKLDAYRRASLYVLPSASENFGITIAESLAAGTPVVTTRGTPWSGLAGKRAGWCTDHGEEALTAVLTEALSLDPETLDAMGRRGRDWMRESFSWDSVAERMEAVYRWLALGDVRPADVED
jgi:glycosyltransferase involved in cell wall biosynthesis